MLPKGALLTPETIGLVLAAEMPEMSIVSDEAISSSEAILTCIQILNEGGFLRRGLGVVDLLGLPHGLTAEETKRYLHENGAKISGQTPRGPSSA